MVSTSFPNSLLPQNSNYHNLWNNSLYKWFFVSVLTLMIPSSDFVEIHDYPNWLINSRQCRLLCDSGYYIFSISCTLPSSVLMAYLLFIEQDVGTDFYITESYSIYAFSCLLIMIIYHKTRCIKETFIYKIKCNKGHNFVIYCIALYWLKFFRAASDKIGLLNPSSLTLWNLCWKSLCQKYCFVVFINVKKFKTSSYAQWFSACSTPNTSASL